MKGNLDWKSRLEKYLEFLEDEVKKGYDFGKKEAPAVLKEMVLMGRISTTMIGLTVLLVGIGLVALPFALAQAVPKEYVVYLFLLFIPYVMGVWKFVSVLAGAERWFRDFSIAWFAPRLFLIRELNKGVRGHD